MKGLLLFTLLVASCHALTCGKYMCATANNTAWESSLNCERSQEIQGVNTFTLWPCTNSTTKTFCQFTNTVSDNFISCTVPTVPTATKSYPGEPCATTDDCNIGDSTAGKVVCTNKVCVGVASGGGCTDTAQCGPGLYCATENCAPLLEAGSATECIADTDCAMNAGCLIKVGTTKGTCTTYFSVKNGSAAGTCGNNDIMMSSAYGLYSNFCESGTCIKGATAQDQNTCIPALKANNQKNPCQTTDDCKTSNGDTSPTNRNTPCTCGFNKDGYAYCNAEVGDDAFTSYLTQIKNLLSQANLSKCHTMRHVAWSKCLNIALSQSDLYKFNAASYYATNYAMVQENDWCVQGTFTATYWNDYYQSHDRPTKPHDAPWDHHVKPNPPPNPKPDNDDFGCLLGFASAVMALFLA